MVDVLWYYRWGRGGWFVWLGDVIHKLNSTLYLIYVKVAQCLSITLVGEWSNQSAKDQSGGVREFVHWD